MKEAIKTLQFVLLLMLYISAMHLGQAQTPKVDFTKYTTWMPNLKIKKKKKLEPKATGIGLIDSGVTLFTKYDLNPRLKNWSLSTHYNRRARAQVLTIKYKF